MKQAFFLMLFMTLTSCRQNNPSVNLQVIEVNTPFAIAGIEVPDYTECPEFTITEFGAVLGDKEKTSSAIEQAIDKANKAGGGVVIIPDGEWITGKIHLKSNVNLHLNKEAVLVFSGEPGDYLPAVLSTWEGLECYNYSPLMQ